MSILEAIPILFGLKIPFISLMSFILNNNNNLLKDTTQQYDEAGSE